VVHRICFWLTTAAADTPALVMGRGEYAGGKPAGRKKNDLEEEEKRSRKIAESN
jgi:hypothetical protein